MAVQYPLRSALPALAVAAIALVAPAAASAGVTTTSVDGPSLSVGQQAVDVAVAPDGTAAIAYLKTVAAVPHVFVSRLVNGVWQSPEQVDAGLADQTKASTTPAIGVSNGGHIVVVFPNGPANAESLYAAVKPSTNSPFDPVKQIQGDTPGWNGPRVKLAPGGDGYLTVYEGNQLWAQRISGSTFTPVNAGFPSPAGILNGDPGKQALSDNQHGARIAVDASGAAGTIAWSEPGPVAGNAVYARRLTGTSAGPAVDGELASYKGHAQEPSANDDVSIASGGGKTWVGFHAQFEAGAVNHAHGIVRPFNGTTFGAAQQIDGIPEPSDDNAEFPKLAMNESGQGLGASYRGLTHTGADGSILKNDIWSTGAALDATNDAGAAAATPSIDTTGVGDIAFYYQSSTVGDPLAVKGKVFGGPDDGKLSTLSNPAFGNVTSAPSESGAGGGHAVTAFVQGTGATTRIVAAVTDLPAPPTPTPTPTPSPGPTPTPIAIGGNTGTPNTITAVAFKKASSVVRTKSAPKVVTSKSGLDTLRFSVSYASTITLTVSKVLHGRTKGGKCVKQTKANKHAKACTAYTPVAGSATLSVPAGASYVAFGGTLKAGKLLPLGSYQLKLAAGPTPGNQGLPTATVGFTLVSPPKKKAKH